MESQYARWYRQSETVYDTIREVIAETAGGTPIAPDEISRRVRARLGDVEIGRVMLETALRHANTEANRARRSRV